MDAVLKNVALDYAGAAGAAGVEIVVESSEPIHVACSAAVLTSIIQNLVSNAIKYMGESPVRRVSLSATTLGGRASVEVIDSGPGIPAEVQAREDPAPSQTATIIRSSAES